MNYVASFSPQDRMWTVGYFEPDGEWRAMKDCESDDEAFRFINFLNGGPGTSFGEKRDTRSDGSKRDTILVLNRVTTMLHEAMKAPMDWRTILESAISNLNAHGVNLME